METGRQVIEGEQTRMEVVYAAKSKLPLASLVQNAGFKRKVHTNKGICTGK